MKKYKEVTKPVKELDSVHCDICSSDIPQRTKPDIKKVDYSKHLEFLDPDDDDITVEREIRAYSPYPDGGGESACYTWDICPACFEKVIVKAIEDAGGSPTINKSDY